MVLTNGWSFRQAFLSSPSLPIAIPDIVLTCYWRMLVGTIKILESSVTERIYTHLTTNTHRCCLYLYRARPPCVQWGARTSIRFTSLHLKTFNRATRNSWLWHWVLWMESYKRTKEAFVSNLNGTSFSEISGIISIIPVCLLFRHAVVILTCPLLGFNKW